MDIIRHVLYYLKQLIFPPQKKDYYMSNKKPEKAKKASAREELLPRVHPNITAFLDMIAYAEIGPKLLKESDNGYNVLYGGTTFDSYADHPRQMLTYKIGGRDVTSSAAGRYQILSRYWDHYRKKLGLKDFSPASQDAYAVRQLVEQRAIKHIVAGDFEKAVDKVKNIWASMPGAGYDQPEKKLADLKKVYEKAGGTLAA
jgi:muramidase (phage lysozyme)